MSLTSSSFIGIKGEMASELKESKGEISSESREELYDSTPESPKEAEHNKILISAEKLKDLSPQALKQAFEECEELKNKIIEINESKLKALTPLLVLKICYHALTREVTCNIRDGGTDLLTEARLLQFNNLLDRDITEKEEGLIKLNTHLIERSEATKDFDASKGRITKGPKGITGCKGPRGPRGLCCSQGKFYSAITGKLVDIKKEKYPYKNCIPICTQCSF
jgi:hypothetical protein